MPQIRDYSSPQLNAEAATGQSNAELYSNGSGGKALQNLAGAVGDVGEMVYRRQVQSETSDLNAMFSEARADWAQKLDDQIANGTISTQKAKEDYQNYINKMNENVTTREGRDFFDRQSASLNSYILKNAARGEARVAGEKAVSNYMTALNTDSNLLQRRPGDFMDTYNSSIDFINEQVSSGILDTKNAELLKSRTGLELSKNAVRGLIKQSPEMARQALDKGTYDKYLDPDAKASLGSQIESEIRSREVQALKTAALKDKDPWQYIQKTTSMEGYKPLSLGADVAESFNQRAQFVEQAKRQYGVNLPFLPQQEADKIAENLINQKPNDSVSIMNNIDNNVSDELKKGFAMQIFAKEPALTAAVMTAGDAPEDARKIVAGMRLLRKGDEGTGKAISPPPENLVQQSFDAYIGAAVDDPMTRRSARQAINAHMIQSMMERGQTDFAGFTPEEFEESAKAIMGPVVKIGDMQTMSFRGKNGKFLDESDLMDHVDRLDDKTIERVQGDVPRTMAGEPINMEKSKGRVSLKAVGDGLYYVFRDSKPAWNKQKQPFVLNLKKIVVGQSDTTGMLKTDPGMGGMGFGL